MDKNTFKKNMTTFTLLMAGITVICAILSIVLGTIGVVGLPVLYLSGFTIITGILFLLGIILSLVKRPHKK